MMKQQVPDRKRLRREYLRKKAVVYSLVGRQVILLLAFCLGRFLSHGAVKDVITLLYFASLVSVVVLSWSPVSPRRQLDKLTYVPPVTPDTLPADEILVRGSEAPPVAQSEVLLRAAQGQETLKEELLRASGE